MTHTISRIALGALLAACAAPPEEDAEDVGTAADALDCSPAGVATCQRHKGGNACVTRCQGSAGGSTNGRGSRLAALALRRDGYGSTGRCYEHVYYAIRDSGITSQAVLDEYGIGYGSAWDFARFGASNPSGMSRVGFVRSAAPPTSLPKGTVLVWRPGQCGYNATHGHIEVVVGGGRACSDFCGPIKTGCGAPVAYVPR